MYFKKLNLDKKLFLKEIKFITMSTMGDRLNF